MPVSYTHLDVYKRQSLYSGELNFCVGLAIEIRIYRESTHPFSRKSVNNIPVNVFGKFIVSTHWSGDNLFDGICVDCATNKDVLCK